MDVEIGAREQLVRKTLEGVVVSDAFTAKLAGRKRLTPAQIRTAVRFAVLARTDDVVKNAWVGWLLSILPGHSPAEITRLLTAGGIDAGRHIGDLTEQQRRYLLDAVSE